MYEGVLLTCPLQPLSRAEGAQRVHQGEVNELRLEALTDRSGSMLLQDEEEEAMPEAPAAAGGVQLGARLPTHRRGRVHTELADLALVQVES